MTLKEELLRRRQDALGRGFLIKYYESLDWICEGQKAQIEVLLKRLSDYEEELYEKDTQIAKLQYALQKTHKKFSMEGTDLRNYSSLQFL